MSVSPHSTADVDAHATDADGTDREAIPRWDSAVALAFFVAGFGFGAWRLRYGIDLRDEAFYLATPLRYALGDLPFRDEIFNPARMFDLLLAPLFMLIPDISVLDLRIGWLCAQLAATAALFVLLRRFAPSSVVASGCMSVVFLPNLYWTPSYHLIGTFGFVLAWSLWLLGCLQATRGRSIRLGLLAGVAYGFAAVAYLPTLATGIVPAVVFLVELARRRSVERLWATGAFLTTLAAIAFAWVVGIWANGLLAEWREALDSISTTANYAAPAIEKVIRFTAGIADTQAFFFAGMAIAVLLLLLQYLLARFVSDTWVERIGFVAMGSLGFGASHALLFLGTMPARHFYMRTYRGPFEITAMVFGVACASFGLAIARRMRSTVHEPSSRGR